MTTSYDDVDQLLVLIDVDDPATRDQDFLGFIKYGGFVKRMAEFTDENRELARNLTGIMHNRFVIELYMDKFADFMFRCLPNSEVRRSLSFKTFYMSISDDPDEEGTEELAFVYELKTVGAVEEIQSDDSFAVAEPEEGPTVLH